MRVGDVMPHLYDFNPTEAHLVSQAYHKQFGLGQTLRGETYLNAVQTMIEQGIVTLTPIEKQEKGRKPSFKMHLTDKGKKAWNNFSRKAAGLPPI